MIFAEPCGWDGEVLLTCLREIEEEREVLIALRSIRCPNYAFFFIAYYFLRPAHTV